MLTQLVTDRSKDAPEEAPSFPKGLRDAVVDEDSPLTFSTPFLGNPVPDILWAKDGIPLTPSERVTMTCDGTKVHFQFAPFTSRINKCVFITKITLVVIKSTHAI